MFAIAVLTAYWVYIWRNSKKTILLRHYLAMLFFAILILLGRYLTGISPGDTVRSLFLTASYLFLIVFLIHFIFFIRNLYKEKPPYHLVYIIATVLFVFLVFPLLFAFNRLFSPVDLLPLAVFFLFTLFFVGAYRFGLFDILPPGIIKALELLNEGIVVFDGTGAMIYSNRSFRNQFNDFLSVISDMVRENLKEISRAKNLPVRKDIECRVSGRVLRLWIRPIPSLTKGTTGYTCIVHDDSDIVALIRDLEEKNRQLEAMYSKIEKLSREIESLTVLNERNILAKEIHDVLGHSLNYTLHVLESNRIILNENPKRALDRLREAITHIDRGLKEISASSLNERNNLSRFDNFCAALEQMAEKQKDIGVNISIVSLEDLRGCSENILKTLYRISQEAITNSIKHGGAGSAIISIKKKDDSILLHIVDDGAGCPDVVKGSGLKGMESRVQELGGSINFSSFEDGSGFQVKASIPLA